jgi:hypothetical protein
MHHFATAAGATPREQDIMGAIKDEELFRSVPGKIKVMSMGHATAPAAAVVRRKPPAP